ncbi:cytochrome b5-like heme/steroid binding domain-containing protein [Aspergillus crustosus]
MGEKPYKLLSRREIEALIADGGKIFILDQFVIKANPWIPYHPGGDKSILHMVGRDATDEVNALHSADAKEKMSRYRIGRIEGRWRNFVPPIQGGRFRSLADNSEVECDYSSDDSRGASPIFDTDHSGLRHRSEGAISSSV